MADRPPLGGAPRLDPAPGPGRAPGSASSEGAAWMSGVEDELPASNVAWSEARRGDGEHPFASPERERYRDPQLMAQGGMGRVSVVIDQRLLREVALKEVQADEGAHGLERRLAQEAWIIAQLEHPGIVPVYDAGRGSDGRLFFTMRLIRGRSLAAALAERKIGEAALLRHFLAVCQAMSYAHARGIVHRDLKPANIMLGAFGETHVVDWGVARVIGADGVVEGVEAGPSVVPEGHGARTLVGTRVGTPAYMSPEQALAAPVGRPSDVWSLGAILFEILAGRALFAGLTTVEIFGRLERGPLPRLEEVAPRTPPELAAIVARALDPDPARRYADAGHLAEDVAAWLDGRRVRAHAYSAWDMARRFGRAFRVPLIVAGVAVVAIAFVFALSYSQTLDERDRAQAAEGTAEAARDRAIASERAATRALAELLVQRAREAQRDGAQAEAEVLAAHALMRGPSASARGVLARYGAGARVTLREVAEPADCLVAALSPDGARVLCLEADATALWSVSPHQLVWRIPRRFDAAAFVSNERALVADSPLLASALLDIDSGALLPFGQALVTARIESAAGTLLADDGGNGLVMWRDDSRGPVRIAAPQDLPRALSGDGRVAIAHDTQAGHPVRLDLETLQPTPMAPVPFNGPGAFSVALDRRGERAAFGSVRGELVIVAVADGTVLLRRRVTERALTQIAWAPDDRWLATRDERGFVRIIDTRGDGELALPRTRVTHMAWREQSGRLTLVTFGEQLALYSVPREVEPNVLVTATGLSSLALDSRRELLALPEGNGDVGVYRVPGGEHVTTIPGDGHAVAKAAAFLPDGSIAVAWPSRLLLAIARLAEGGAALPGAERAATTSTPSLEVLDDGRNYRRVVATDSGDLYAAGYGATVHHLSRGRARRMITLGDGGSPLDLAASRDGRVVAWLSSRGGVEVARGELAEPVASVPGAIRIALNGDGSRLAVARPENVRVFAPDGERAFEVPGARIAEVALSDDGALVAAGTIDGQVWLWDATGAVRMMGAGHGERVSGLVFGPGWLTSAGWDGVAIRWELGVLDEPAADLVARLQRGWGLTLEHAVRAETR